MSERTILAHNAEFDLTVIAKALENRHMPLPICGISVRSISAERCITTARTSRATSYCPISQKTLGVELECHHNALFDTRACAGIFLRLSEMYEFDPGEYVRKFVYPKPKRPFCGRGKAGAGRQSSR